jgi:hypothetical protein
MIAQLNPSFIYSSSPSIFSQYQMSRTPAVCFLCTNISPQHWSYFISFLQRNLFHWPWMTPHLKFIGLPRLPWKTLVQFDALNYFSQIPPLLSPKFLCYMDLMPLTISWYIQLAAGVLFHSDLASFTIDILYDILFLFIILFYPYFCFTLLFSFSFSHCFLPYHHMLTHPQTGWQTPML